MIHGTPAVDLELQCVDVGQLTPLLSLSRHGVEGQCMLFNVVGDGLAVGPAQVTTPMLLGLKAGFSEDDFLASFALLADCALASFTAVLAREHPAELFAAHLAGLFGFLARLIHKLQTCTSICFGYYYSSMWNLVDANPKVGVFMKTEYFKKHIKTLKKTKATVDFYNSRPWSPTFQLAQTQNRYSRDKQREVEHENYHLLKRICEIQNKPPKANIKEVPQNIPSRSIARKRQRDQNLQMLTRIASVSTSYDRLKLESDFVRSQKYKLILARKQNCLDFRNLAHRSMAHSRQKSAHLKRSTHVGPQEILLRRRDDKNNCQADYRGFR